MANRSQLQTNRSDEKCLESFSTSLNVHNKWKEKLIALLNGK